METVYTYENGTVLRLAGATRRAIRVDMDVTGEEQAADEVELSTGPRRR